MIDVRERFIVIPSFEFLFSVILVSPLFPFIIIPLSIINIPFWPENPLIYV